MEADVAWRKETVPRVMVMVCSRLSQGDVCSLLLVSPWCCRALISVPSLWQVLDLHGVSKAGDKLIAALSLPRYKHVQHINLEFAQDIGDQHLIHIRERMGPRDSVQSLNLNACQKISDKGTEAVSYAFPNLKALSIYWNVRLSDIGINHLVMNCRYITDLNLSGCKNISDHSLFLIAGSYRELTVLNLTRCVKLTDAGLKQVLIECSSLRSLNLYADSNFTDNTYKNIGFLKQLRFLDLCGSQNLSDSALFQIAMCRELVTLNLTWCVRVTDSGVAAIARGCTNLEFLSLFGIIGVTDKCLEVLSVHCTKTLATLDVNGCIGIKRRSQDDLLRLFPNLRCFKVHS